MAAKNQDVECANLPADVFPEHEPAIKLNVGSASGTVTSYEIREFGPDGLGWWGGQLVARSKDGQEDYVGMHEDLIEKCLYLNDKPVPRSVIAAWGPKLKTRAYRLCQRVNGLDGAGLEGKG